MAVTASHSVAAKPEHRAAVGLATWITSIGPLAVAASIRAPMAAAPSVSVGSATLMARVDRALYRAKLAGKGQLCG